MSRRKTNAQTQRFEGPTAERLFKSDGYVSVGGGTRVYHMLDSVLDRTYADLQAKHGTAEQDELRAEYSAQKKLLDKYIAGALMGTVGSVDVESAAFAGGEGRDHAAKTDYQVAARFAFHSAKGQLSPYQWRVVEYVVLLDESLIQAGFNVLGCRARTRAFEKARTVLRGSGEALAKHWGIK